MKTKTTEEFWADYYSNIDNDSNEIKKTDLNNLSRAMFAPSFPCNPLPFLNGLCDGCKLYGSDYIKTDEGKRILYVLIALSYGQLFDIDSLTEFSRLK